MELLKSHLNKHRRCKTKNQKWKCKENMFRVLYRKAKASEDRISATVFLFVNHAQRPMK